MGNTVIGNNCYAYCSEGGNDILKQIEYRTDGELR